ncbi:hypothetical protein DDB_G0290655 [Dictyostelium discoideum AX4]|uniref:Putative uncharacterized protein DDB_G0290655 n=1 Tax=Dictyostelium discoideum TaxID=44689 RepID=Y9575_DICDI|nr:hypothetical protein DDB_G0290655 [Dictyostelium discoideum AX4]Q54FX8.1 RecName: Full=Putative uncharacterized protein DDB_G0290655 [Dictyostelium discoideum]EAL62188.1 hypothetical protein DDB_G0290655 [Dictyostelium discoideum AX4]|eukprot:XP_635639.1 hypothetical protein DDB_G0290655 [Dictyostelium discoideum AX4]
MMNLSYNSKSKATVIFVSNSTRNSSSSSRSSYSSRTTVFSL